MSKEIKLKKYSLYTFTKSKLIWTETENIKQAVNNFNRRLNIDSNGYSHKELEYVFNPIRVITVDKTDHEPEPEIETFQNGEKILAFNCNKLNNLILKDLSWTGNNI